MREERKETPQKLCLAFHSKLTDLLYNVQTGYPGGSLSCTEILTTPYYGPTDVGPMNPEEEDRDHLILSRDHGAPMFYLVLAYKGSFPMDKLKNLCQTGNMPQGHPCVHKTSGVELPTDPLDLGLSMGLRIVLGARLKGYNSYTYVIMGDGEIQEGCMWEAAMLASKFKADHLIGILNNNGVQLDGTLEDIMPMGDVRAKWETFGWNMIPYDDHDAKDICGAVEEAEMTVDKPSLVPVKTVKGKGASSMEDRNIWHGKTIGGQGYA